MFFVLRAKMEKKTEQSLFVLLNSNFNYIANKKSYEIRLSLHVHCMLYISRIKLSILFFCVCIAHSFPSRLKYGILQSLIELHANPLCAYIKLQSKYVKGFVAMHRWLEWRDEFDFRTITLVHPFHFRSTALALLTLFSHKAAPQPLENSRWYETH